MCFCFFLLLSPFSACLCCGWSWFIQKVPQILPDLGKDVQHWVRDRYWSTGLRSPHKQRIRPFWRVLSWGSGCCSVGRNWGSGHQWDALQWCSVWVSQDQTFHDRSNEDQFKASILIINHNNFQIWNRSSGRQRSWNLLSSWFEGSQILSPWTWTSEPLDRDISQCKFHLLLRLFGF